MGQYLTDQQSRLPKSDLSSLIVSAVNLLITSCLLTEEEFAFLMEERVFHARESFGPADRLVFLVVRSDTA